MVCRLASPCGRGLIWLESTEKMSELLTSAIPRAGWMWWETCRGRSGKCGHVTCRCLPVQRLRPPFYKHDVIVNVEEKEEKDFAQTKQPSEARWGLIRLRQNTIQVYRRVGFVNSQHCYYNRLGQYATSPGNRAYCYAELLVSFLAVAVFIGCIHYAYPRKDGQAELAWEQG